MIALIERGLKPVSYNRFPPFQYCGSCWAFASLSSLADRIKIARNATGVEINLSVQYILNCAGAEKVGSCSGGNMMKLFQFIKETSGFVPYGASAIFLKNSIVLVRIGWLVNK